MKKIFIVLSFLSLNFCQFIVGSSSSSPQVRSAGKMRHESKEIREEIPDDRCLSIIEELIIRNNLRISDWKAIDPEGQEMKKQSNCIDSAAAIIWRLTHDIPFIESLLQCDWEPMERYAEAIMDHRTFIAQEAGTYIHPIAQKIFHESESREHFLCSFNISINHMFIIEIKKDGANSWARIYQSFWKVFTLEDWISEQEWHHKHKNFTHDKFKIFHAQYGKGKKISLEQLAKFIKEVNGLYKFARDRNNEPITPSDILYHIKIFDLDHTMIDNYPLSPLPNFYSRSLSSDSLLSEKAPLLIMMSLFALMGIHYIFAT